MASLRKRLSKWSLNEENGRLRRPVSMDLKRKSFDSGYQSVKQQHLNQVSDASPDTPSPKPPSRILRKVLSTTFGYLADTVRQGAVSLHQEATAEDGSSPEKVTTQTPFETPTKQKHRSSLFSSVRSRKGLFSPSSRNPKSGSPKSLEATPSPTRFSDESAPFLDLNLPGPSLNSESPSRVGVPPSPLGGIGSWAGPSNVATSTAKPYNDQNEPFVDVLIPGPSVPQSSKLNYNDFDDKGYVAESESGAERSESEAPSPNIPHGPMDYAEPLPSSKESHHTEAGLRPRLGDLSGSPTRLTGRPTHLTMTRLPLQPVPSEEDFKHRLPSDVYEADVESSGDGLVWPPSMGSRTAWDRAREDRHRRYVAIFSDEDPTDSTRPLTPQSPKTPEITPVSFIPDEIMLSDGVGEPFNGPHYPKGTLRYSVEAAERLSGLNLLDDLEAGEGQFGWGLSSEAASLSDHVAEYPTISMPSECLTVDDIMTLDGANESKHQDSLEHLYDSETDISGGSTLQTAISQSVDAYDAGLRAAGLVRPHVRHPSITMPEILNPNLSKADIEAGYVTPVHHIRSPSNLSEITNESCAVTTNSPSCKVCPPFPCLHVRSEPVRFVPLDLTALSAREQLEIPLKGPRNRGLVPLADPIQGVEPNKIKKHDESKPAPIDDDPSLVTTDAVKTSHPQTPDGTPQKTFNAAKLPVFGPSSPSSSSPQNKRSVRPAKKKSRRAARSGKASKQAASKGFCSEKGDSPQFTVKHFQKECGDPSPYAGYSPEPVSFGSTYSQRHARMLRVRSEGRLASPADFMAAVRRTPAGSSSPESQKKAVCFAKEVEIIGRNGGDEREMAKTECVDKGVPDAPKSRKELIKELEEMQQRALDRLERKLMGEEDAGSDQDKENDGPDDMSKAEKPRWRVP